MRPACWLSPFPPTPASAASSSRRPIAPPLPGNAAITDLQFAPRNAQGQVEYVTTFSLSKPVDMAKASGVLWYELVNRAGPLRTFGSMAPYGHVTLMNGWQGDIAPTANNYTV